MNKAKLTEGQIKRLTKNRERLEMALQEHGTPAMEPATLAGWSSQRPLGSFLYAFLDAAVGKLLPSEADQARKNAVRWLRRRAKIAQGTTEQ